jgi:hypothetical protein
MCKKAYRTDYVYCHDKKLVRIMLDHIGIACAEDISRLLATASLARQIEAAKSAVKTRKCAKWGPVLLKGGAPTQSRGHTALGPKQTPHTPLPSPKWVSGLSPRSPGPTPKAVAAGASPTKAVFEQNTCEEIRKEAKQKKRRRTFVFRQSFSSQ